MLRIVVERLPTITRYCPARVHHARRGFLCPKLDACEAPFIALNVVMGRQLSLAEDKVETISGEKACYVIHSFAGAGKQKGPAEARPI